MSFFINVLIGLIIGIGFIIPGVSGGALAVVMGVYDKIIVSITNIKKDFKKSIIFLFPILIGIIIGVIVFSNLLLLLFNYREMPVKYIFIGLVLGGVPALLKSIKQKNVKISITPALVTFIISIFLFILEKNNLGLNLEEQLVNGYMPIIGLFIAGILYAAGKIVPGISGAALLMLVGMYEYLLNLIANPLSITLETFIILIPFFIGAIIGMIILFKLLNFLINNYYGITYSAIIGFVLGSLLYIYPGFSFDFLGFLCIVLFLFSMYFSYLLTK